MTVTAEKLVLEIQKILNSDIVEQDAIYAKVCKKKHIQKRTFHKYLAIARQRNKELAHKAEITLANTYALSIEEATKRGLKSKLHRVMEKQADVDRLRKMASDGLCDDVYFDSKGKPKEFKRKMTPSEIAQVLRHATAIEAEISKIMDDYPIQKHAIQAQVIHVQIATDQNNDEDADYTIPEVE